MIQLPLLPAGAPPAKAPQHPQKDVAPGNHGVQRPDGGADRQQGSFRDVFEQLLAGPGTAGGQHTVREQADAPEKADDAGAALAAAANAVPGQAAPLLAPAAPAPSTADPLATPTATPATTLTGDAAGTAAAADPVTADTSAAPAGAEQGLPKNPGSSAGHQQARTEDTRTSEVPKVRAVQHGTGPGAGAAMEPGSTAAVATGRVVSEASFRRAPENIVDPAPGQPALAVAAASAAPVQVPTTAQAAPAAVPSHFSSPQFAHLGRLAPQLAGPLFTLATAAPGEHVMTLRMSPESLGPLTVRAHIDAAGVRIELFAPGDAGRDALRTILPELRRGLAESGLGANLNLSQHGAPPDPHSGGPGGQAAGQQGGPGHRNQPGQPSGAQPEPVPPRPRAAVVLSGTRPGVLDILV